MSLSAGARIGSYEVLGQIGVGGMGEVYRAHDTRLRRDVAIKVLPSLLANDVERLARFEREAQMLAALNHPHIASIYGFEEAAGTRCLIMELIEGPTLAARIASGPVPIAEALGYARQIADALEVAHEKGIIHRDLKPANVKLTTDGEVKVLDFGLAKALDPGATSGSVSDSPTLTARATQLGMILGTAAYMAPEQARGKPVDRRADVWGFGCVLYELVTGRRAFDGAEVTDVLARVIERDPDWSALPAATPPVLRRLLLRCLTKDPKARLRDIGEARIAIDEMLAGHDGTPAAPDAPIPAMVLRDRRSSAVPWAVAAAMGAVAISAFVWPRGGAVAPSSATDARVTRVELSLPPDVEFFSSPRVSRDGARVAFVGVREGIRQVYLRDLNQPDTRAIAGTDGANMAAFSPDGRAAVVLFTDGRLRRLTFETGILDDVGTGADILGGVEWSLNGSILFAQINRIVRVPAGGGDQQELVTLDKAGGETSLVWPVVTPDGTTVLFTSWRETTAGTRARIEAVPAGGGPRRVVIDGAEYVVAITAGRIAFQREGGFYVAPFDEANAQLAGAPIRISEQIHMNPNGSPAADLADTGALIFAASSVFHGRLVWVSHDGIERVIKAPPRGYQNVRVSPDGQRVAFSEAGAIWTIDVDRGAMTRVYMGANGLTGFPVWSADGTRLFFRSSDGIYVHRADGEGQAQLLAGTSRLDYPGSVSEDGTQLAFLRILSDRGGDILVTPTTGGAMRTIVATRAYEGGPQISPDGKWLAYVSNESGRMEVYLRPMEGPDRKWPVSAGGGLHPLWSRDGRQVFFRAGQQMRVVDVQTTPEVRLGSPRTLFERRYSFGPNLTVPNYSLSKDGKQLLLVREESGSGHLSLVFNWLQNVGR